MIVASELLILTREQYSALSLANNCINAVKTKYKTEIKILYNKISKNLEMEFYEQFNAKKLIIFAFLREKLTDLAIENQQLYKIASKLTNKPEFLEKFGKLLKSHARLENRGLFPNIDLLSPSQRRKILNSSAKHASASIYE
ncbi:hypothetical protein N9345_06190 [Candidatus Thioglobus sp.]|nr:hypothetical protein [Candidatus Thioglobus sp.]